MDNAGYAAITRQSGLMREMQAVAHNIANAATTGFRREGVIFSEFVERLDGKAPSLSMGTGNVRMIGTDQGPIRQTRGAFDLAIEGNGYFLVETGTGQALTRAGAFTPSANGELATPDGHRLLDAGGAPVFVPPDARSVAVGRDGTLSADGRPLARIGLWQPAADETLTRATGVLFRLSSPPEPVEAEGVILQGFIEGSNVDPVSEVTRMIEVQRAYELGQTFLDREDERIRAVTRTLGSQ
ncbi:flagellar basal-body rod protein FlgF [Tranquillimonas rosea]|uniref:Flagellar basal-body rod protein FlgF n=1 Tax=Tranquillimonas rosea TaxID=641238 RepID=A0A1H9X5L7_9RHOB|nr:flagellar hook-basal body complex protein [Tranquillimonas rosea]SES41157.1 flagellar basal-body rod protein FlgF [Tranquillimonas rosea]